jgi:hypothetical protein
MKGADLLLRPYQQKWLQNKLETLTLKLNYTNILKWYSNHLQYTLLLLIGFFSLILVMSILRNSFLIVMSTALKENVIVFICAIVFLILLNFKTRDIFKKSLEYLEGKDIIVKNENYSLIIFLKRALIVLRSHFILVFSFFLFYCIVFYGIDKLIFKENLPFVNYSLTSVASITIEFLGILIFLTTMILLTLIVGILHFILKIMEAFCWRIIEFNKGAFAAINILITFILGIIEYCLKQ